MNKLLQNLNIVLSSLLVSSAALATPSTTYWAPSTASCQGYGLPHVTYDSYFNRGPTVGADGARGYPVDTGLTAGVLPFEKVQAEIGFDLLLPSEYPLFLNAKVCTPESSLFNGSPAVGVGIYNVGFEKNVTDYNIVYLMLQKTLSGGSGYFSLGVYHGLNKDLLRNSEGNSVQAGLMAGLLSPDISVGLKGLKKINLAADIQTGKNALGAWGVGSYFFFNESISLLLGPVFFLDSDIQPGQSDLMWTAQIDIDIPFK
jgi:hypothetical protein